MIRAIVAKVTAVMTERRHARKKLQVPVKVWFEPRPGVHSKSPHCDVYMSGETYDASESGIALLLSSIRIKEDYLVSVENRLFNVELDISGKKIRMKVIGRRYERVGIHLSTERYLVGAEIVDIDPEDRRSYEYFMKHGNKLVAAVPAKVQV